MNATGFDGIVFSRRNLVKASDATNTEEKLRDYKAYLVASITTENDLEFRSAYDDAIDNVFSKLKAVRKKRVYKAAHLTKQLKEKADDFIPKCCESLTDEIAEVGIYFCHFDRPFISAYGRGSGTRFHPRDFITKNPDLLLHVCALIHAKKSGNADESIQMDHFEANTTPAWRDLIKLDRQTQIYYSGGECNALISVADQILRVINWHQHGWVDPTSILKPIREHLPKLSKKLKFYGVGKTTKELNLLVPDLELGTAKEDYLKHPMFFSSGILHIQDV